MRLLLLPYDSGYNQEDSIIMNQSAIERGLFVSDCYKTYKDEEKKDNHQVCVCKEKFTRPNLKNIVSSNNYNKLTENGFPHENEHVVENDVIIGKIHPIHSKKDEKDIKKLL